ncbi:MAG: methionine--tRNA ligase [Candidatus Colwellbacteria bacterium]|nr:methionine--tRNA ligase [Candidatus Colwellbacteria bacterium]
MDTIPFEDFKKLDIRIGTIISAEPIEGADKLLRLVINFGSEERQVLAGIAQFVSDPLDLIGKQIPVLINLEPRRMRGLDSNGMILAADADGKPVLLTPEEDVPPGSVVK